MKLIGVSKIDFEKWYYKTHCTSSTIFEHLLPHEHHEIFSWFYNSCYTIQLAFYVEFFDTVGLFIHVDNLTNTSGTNGKYWQSYVNRNYKNRVRCGLPNETREGALKFAVIKANNLHNGI